jgi:hypothetical protein
LIERDGIPLIDRSSGGRSRRRIERRVVVRKESRIRVWIRIRIRRMRGRMRGIRSRKMSDRGG